MNEIESKENRSDTNETRKKKAHTNCIVMVETDKGSETVREKKIARWIDRGRLTK